MAQYYIPQETTSPEIISLDLAKAHLKVDFDTDDVSKIVFNDNGKKFTFSSVAEFNRHFTREKQPNLRKVYPEPK